MVCPPKCANIRKFLLSRLPYLETELCQYWFPFRFAVGQYLKFQKVFALGKKVHPLFHNQMLLH